MSKLNEYVILYVDDEELSLKYFDKQFSKDFNVVTASSAVDGWDLIQKQAGRIGVLMSDQRMPGQTGVQLLEKVRYHFPHVIRILVTAYSDIDSAIAGVNAGAIYKYISKPWDVTDLRITLLRALEFYAVLTEKDQLLREKLSVLHQIVLCDRTKNLAVLAAGLSSHFRNALEAAQAFAFAIPPAAIAPVVEASARGDAGRNIEAHLNRASRDISHMAEAMKALAEEAPSFSPEPLALETFLEPLAQMNSSSQAHPVSVQIDAAAPRLRANPKQLTRLFALLVSHVSALAPAGARITVSAERAAESQGAERAKISVSDESAEWTSEQRTRLFAPFSSFDQGDDISGLDLAVCFFIVYHHGGRIKILGERSSKVAVELPVDPTADIGTPPPSNQLANLFRQDLRLA
ncbi:MAG: hybrid sensor histidine kinase/response regulator [Verrucomicrobia bacterium]|nr:hybrid sensor histidine kinase/response regulator [Verrucomicrobiota bacterium]